MVCALIVYYNKKFRKYFTEHSSLAFYHIGWSLMFCPGPAGTMRRRRRRTTNTAGRW